MVEIRFLEPRKVMQDGVALLEVNFEKDTFYVDVLNWEFREKGNPLNIISFRDMEYGGVGYTLDYSPKHKNSVENIFESELEGAKINRYCFRDFVKIDPESVSKRFGIPKNQLPENDSLLKCHPKRIKQRIKLGQLPKVFIGKDRMFADTRLMQLRSSELDIWLDMDMLEYNKACNKMFFFYDTVKKEIYDVPGDLMELPKNVVMVTLPPPAELDPVGRARKDSAERYFELPPGDELYYVKYNNLPIRDVHAGVYPLSQSPLVNIIRQNQEWQKKENSLKEKTLRRRKGKKM